MAYLYADLRLFRTLVNTEITIQNTRFAWHDEDWTVIPSGELDENGEPVPAGFVNDVNVVFPAPAPLDLIGVLNYVRLYVGIGNNRTHQGSSQALNLTLSITGQQVVFAPGSLTITLL